jgi:hypothetical protein
LTDETIALINDQFVPFASGWGELQKPEGNPKGWDPRKQRWEPYEWWQDFARASRKTPNGVAFSEAFVPGQSFAGFWVGTSAGERVPAHKAKSAKQQAFAATLKQVLRLYSEMPKEERLPAEPVTDANRPKLAPPAGGVCLIGFDKPLLRKRDGNYCCLTGSRQEKEVLKQQNSLERVPWQPGSQLDALWLTREECESLMPKNPKEGQTFAVSSHLVKRIGLFGLTIRSAMQEMYHWTPESVRQGDLKLTVESVSPTAVAMRLHGSILMSAKAKQMEGHINVADLKSLEDRYDARLEGKLVYDPSKKRFTRWDMVVLGDYTGACCACEFGKYQEDGHFVAKEPLPIAMSFEMDSWNYEMAAEHRRTIPYMFWMFRGRTTQGYDYYFSPEKWEADWIKQGKRGLP